jgi:putative PIN family toxin of toxin-antitoxin system
MKVLIDTNVLLSYLLAPTTPRAVTQVVTACLIQDEIDLLVPPEQVAEFAAKAASKRYFRTRIPHAAIEHFVAELTALGRLLPPLEAIIAYSRDPKDDYLVAYGIVNEADYLITGDDDLLVLGRVGGLGIVNPAGFLALLRARHLLL